MRSADGVAILVSVALHAGVIAFVPAFEFSPAADRASPAPAPAISARLDITQARAPSAGAKRRPSARMAASKVAYGARAARHAHMQRFYPLEAIKLGMEGVTIVMLRIGADGELVDAQIAKSSGYALLDAAALQAAYATPRFAAGAREMLFPVTFALH
jgi:protein TonB